MNIIFIAEFKIIANTGGVGRVTSVLAKEFIKNNIKVFFLALRTGNKEMVESIEQYYLPNSKNIFNTENTLFVKNLMLNKNIDIVINQGGIYKHIINFLNNSIPNNVKLVTVHHNCVSCLNNNYRNIVMGNHKWSSYLKMFDFPFVWRLLKFRNKILYGNYFKNAILKSDKFLLLSNSFIEELRFYVKGYDKNKVAAIPNPLPFKTNRDSINNKQNSILYVGRLSFSQKRVERLIEIWDEIFLKFPNWEFDIVGDGSARSFLEEEVKRKGLLRINFHGYQDPQPFYRKSKIFVMTSDFEGFGMVLVEAQAFGVVPIMFNCFSSINDVIVNDKTGMIIDNFNIDHYINSLKGLMEKNKRLHEMAYSATTHVKKFNASLIANEWINLLKNILEDE